MTTRHRFNDYARAIYADTHTVTAQLDAALRSLEDSMAGYPSTTPGAAPSTSRAAIDPLDAIDGPVHLTSTERLAMSTDRAQRDLEALRVALIAAHRHLASAAVITLRWGSVRVDDTTVTKRLAGAVTADHGIWCRNCSRHGVKEPRAEGKSECRFCADFRRTYGIDAPQAVHDVRQARGGRLFVQDIERILDRESPGWRKNRPKAKGERKSA